MRYVADDAPGRQALVDLYSSVGWTAYTDDPGSLETAVTNSTFVVCAYDDDVLVGLARGLSDDVSIFYLQDVLVRPTHQSQGVGKALLQRCRSRFEHVRQKVLLTDDLEHQHRLYQSLGYSDIASLENVPLHAFVQINGIELS